MRGPDVIQDQIEKIRECNDAISVITHLLTEFRLDSDCGNEIPERINNGYIKGGLLNALKIAVYASDEAAELIDQTYNRKYAMPNEADCLKEAANNQAIQGHHSADMPSNVAYLVNTEIQPIAAGGEE
jgi:hypothetical protein